MTGKQLKNSILQWAIQGKLVPQDPNDEPASVLLEKIRAEKELLIKEGKIKRDKKESIIYRGDDNSYYEKFLATGEVKCIDDEIPFEIPQGWEWCRINKVIRLISGRDLEPSQYNDTQLGIPYITGASNFHNENLVINRWTSFPVTISHKGELLITCKGTIGDMAFNTIGDIHIARQIMSIDSDYINLNYLKIYLEVYVTELQKAAKSIIPGISRGDLLTALIPIPPFNEQIRIYNFIDNLIPKVVLYGEKQRALEMLNDNIMSLLRKSILQEAIQGRLMPQNSNDEPASVLLGRIRREKERLLKEGKLKKKDIVDSVIFKGDDNKYYEQINGTPQQIEVDYTFPNTWEVVRLSHICRLMDGEKKEGNYICLDAKYLRGNSLGDTLPKGKFVSKGDNIILVDGENSGEVFAVPHDGYMGSTFKQLWVSGNMHLPYVLYFIQFYKDLLRNSKKGAAIPHLNKNIFYSLVIGIPPYQEQMRIVNRIQELFDKTKGS